MIDRSRFQGAKLSAIKDVQKNAEEHKKLFGEKGSRIDFLDIDEGRNVFRILPPHPEDPIGSAYMPRRMAMMKCEVDVYENGEVTGRTEVKFKNIFIATQHGGLPQDPIEMYIDYVRKYANDAIDSKEERQRFLYPITGWRDKKGWNWGIVPKTNYVCYAIKDGKMGRLELYESWIKDMQKLAITEDPNDVISMDPFSDPNEGFPLIITKGKDDKNKTTFTLTKDEPSRLKREGWEAFFDRTKITDEQLLELEKQEPLSKLYGSDVYSKRDFNLALDAIRRFDDENKYGIFDNDDFLNELAAIEALVPEPPDKDDDIKEMFAKKEEPAKVETQASESTEEELTIPEMKAEITKYVKKKFGEAYLSQIPMKRIDIVTWYAMIEEGKELPIVKSVAPLGPTGPVAAKVEKSEPEAQQPEEQRAETPAENPALISEIDKLRQRRQNLKNK